MSTPAGWYDDGSGRQRWWDGTQWTEDYAPGHAAPPPATSEPVTSAYLASAPATPTATPILGFIGLGLAVLGTLLAFIPTIATFVIAVVVLLAAFVVSLIAVFKKNTTKWPSIVGMVLSVVGGIIGSVVFAVVLFASLVSGAVQSYPTDVPTPTTSEQPSESSDERPAPDEIAVGYKTLLNDGGITMYDDDPEFFECVGQFFHDSELSDQALQTVAAGADVTDSERDLAIQVSAEATLTCDPL